MMMMSDEYNIYLWKGCGYRDESKIITKGGWGGTKQTCTVGGLRKFF